jgi:HAD superfamily hydrolase (TIGR01509 family)
MIRAIVFDCFGVLAREGLGPFLHDNFEDRPDLRAKATVLADDTNAGRISYEEFVAGLSDLAHLSEPLVRRQIENNAPNEPLFEFIAMSLKPHFKIGLLSNAAADWLQELFTAEQVGLFDATALSYEMRAIKPDAKAYSVIAERLGLEMPECVMIDDQKTYCIGARDAGMQALVYETMGQLKSGLSEIIGTSL